jgi:cold-inducible RNA-binding protein
MNRNLYIGNLSGNVTENVLRDNFSEVGNVVSVNIIKDKYTGQSRGFGFVEMETDEAAKSVIEKFNGGTLDALVIVVNEAREKKDQLGQRRNDNRGGGFRGGRRY